MYAEPDFALECFKNAYIKKFGEGGEISVHKAEKSPHHIITVKFHETAWRIGSSLERNVAYVKIGGKSEYIAFQPQNKTILEKADIPFTTVKSSPLLRVPLDVFENTNQDTLHRICAEILMNSCSFPAFGCCGRFKECADTKVCTHPDQIYAKSCQYKKLVGMK